MNDVTRRSFLAGTATLAAGATLATDGATQDAATVKTDSAQSKEFHSTWHETPNRVWIGPEYWANPLQDWRIAGGRLECIKAAPERRLHLLTREIGEKPGTLQLSVKVGRIGSSPLGKGQGSCGFRIGIRGPLPDYRNALLSASGMNAGITADGRMFIGTLDEADAGAVDLSNNAVELRLSAEAQGETCTLTLTAHDDVSGKQLGSVSRAKVPAAQLAGGIALVANCGAMGNRRAGAPKGKAAQQMAAAAGVGEFWFGDWKVAGSMVTAHDERAFGPVLFTQYTLSGNVLKLTAQMPPMGDKDDFTVRLQVRRDDAWQTIGEAKIDPDARTATFRIEKWDSGRDVPYRVAYSLRTSGGETREHFWTGTIRRDPVDARVLTVADVSCNGQMAFPNAECVERMSKLKPDLLAFTGDQFYERSGGYGVQRGPVDVAILDMLHKWYLHGWTWRELMRDRPSVSIPDDHDVYHGNIWGEGGAAVEPDRLIDAGGYSMQPEFVNAVHRTQTSHHPDAFDPAPGKQGISVYFGPLTYGRVSFAILADRQFKTGPDGKVPPTGGRADHVKDPNFDPKTADLPGLELLGERQMKFLRAWAGDWRGADMKAVISQTIFTAMATTHGGNREVLRADYDTNGWPQAARNAALREMRRAFAFHLAGDQHLPAVVHYGIDSHRDGGVAFAGPSVNNVYPRWFEPAGGKVTGDFLDSFGHPMSVLAVANPKLQFRATLLEGEVDKAAGFGIVRFDKQARTITVECWPLLADPTQPGTQFPGWPVTVKQLDNGLPAKALLPKLIIRGSEKPVVQIMEEKSGEILYTLRAPQSEWQPHVFTEGRYTIRVSDPESNRATKVEHIEARPNNTAMLDVTV